MESLLQIVQTQNVTIQRDNGDVSRNWKSIFLDDVREWLPGLNKRHKWFKKEKYFKVGEVVLVLSKESKPRKWILERISYVFLGNGNYIRVAKFWIGDKEYIRPISAIIQKIFETNSGFHVKQRPTGKVQFLFFSSFWLLLKKFSFWQEDWALVYNSSKFWDFLDFSLFPKILSLASFSNLWGNSCTPCLLLIIALHFTSGERKIW